MCLKMLITKPLQATAASKGFTLLEVMVSLVILAGVASFAMQVFYRGMDRSLLIENMAYATVLAESKMDEVLMAEDVVEAAGTGEFVDNSFRYEVTTEMIPYDGDVPDYSLYGIKVVVAWGETEFGEQVELTSLKLVKDEAEDVLRQ